MCVWTYFFKKSLLSEIHWWLCSRTTSSPWGSQNEHSKTTGSFFLKHNFQKKSSKLHFLKPRDLKKNTDQEYEVFQTILFAKMMVIPQGTVRNGEFLLNVAVPKSTMQAKFPTILNWTNRGCLKEWQTKSERFLQPTQKSL